MGTLTDLPASKPNSWIGFAVNTATLVARQIMRLPFQNWIFLPPLLIVEVLRHMSVGHEYGTVIALEWLSVVCWPLVDRS